MGNLRECCKIVAKVLRRCCEGVAEMLWKCCEKWECCEGLGVPRPKMGVLKKNCEEWGCREIWESHGKWKSREKSVKDVTRSGNAARHGSVADWGCKT